MFIVAFFQRDMELAMMSVKLGDTRDMALAMMSDKLGDTRDMELAMMSDKLGDMIQWDGERNLTT
jgi:hypothetical protein